MSKVSLMNNMRMILKDCINSSKTFRYVRSPRVQMGATSLIATGLIANAYLHTKEHDIGSILYSSQGGSSGGNSNGSGQGGPSGSN